MHFSYIIKILHIPMEIGYNKGMVFNLNNNNYGETDVSYFKR